MPFNVRPNEGLLETMEHVNLSWYQKNQRSFEVCDNCALFARLLVTCVCSCFYVFLVFFDSLKKEIACFPKAPKYKKNQSWSFKQSWMTRSRMLCPPRSARSLSRAERASCASVAVRIQLCSDIACAPDELHELQTHTNLTALSRCSRSDLTRWPGLWG